MNIFEYGAKNKLRFSTEAGSITTEDLYDLPLDSTKKVSLNSVAKKVNQQIKSFEEESFVTTATPANTEAHIKLDIIKHVIKERIEQAMIKKNAENDKARRELISGIIAEKQNESLKNMSMEELQAELQK